MKNVVNKIVDFIVVITMTVMIVAAWVGFTAIATSEHLFTVDEVRNDIVTAWEDVTKGW